MNNEELKYQLPSDTALILNIVRFSHLFSFFCNNICLYSNNQVLKLYFKPDKKTKETKSFALK